MTRSGCLLAPLAALFITAAQPAQPQSDADMQSVSVRPGSFHEDCLEIAEGQAIDYVFSSSDTLDFNIHYHVGDDIIFLEEQAAVAAGDGRATAPVAHGYCLMWENRTAEPVELRYRFGLGAE